MKKGRMVQIEYMQIYFKRTKERSFSCLVIVAVVWRKELVRYGAIIFL
jgi:hypothetical protein